MEGALKIMFWTEIKMTASVVLAEHAALRHGPDRLPGDRTRHRRVAVAGKQQSRAGRTRTRGAGRTRSKVDRSRPSPAPSPELDAIGKARIEVAEEVARRGDRLWQAGEIDVGEYLTVQKRFNEVVADVAVKTPTPTASIARAIGHLRSRDRGWHPRKFHEGSNREADLLTVASWPDSTPNMPSAKAKAKVRGNSK